MSEDFISNAEGNFFLQTDWTQVPGWLTCTGVGDVDIPAGDRTINWCQDVLNSGQFKIHGFTRAEAAAGTYSLVKPLSKVYNHLLQVNCDFVGRVNWVCRGTRQDIRNYEIAAIMLSSGITRRGITSPSARAGSEESRVDTNADISFSPLLLISKLTIARVAVDNVAAAYAVNFLPERCADRCGPARPACAYGLMGLEGPGVYVYESEIKKTFDGTTWEATPVDPYTWGGTTQAVLQLETIDGIRYLAFRGSAVGAPAEVGISEDYGVTWRNVNIGAVNGQYVYAVMLAGADIIVACTGGYLYVSSDQGDTWAAQSAGTVTAEDLRDCTSYDGNILFAVGENNVFLYSLNGGNDWNARTGPAAGVNLVSVAVNGMGHVFVGTNDGRLFRSVDQGQNWVSVLDMGAGSIDWIDFDSVGRYIGGLAWNDAASRGYLFRSETGGANWVQQTGTPVNSGINAGYICDPNTIILVGNVHAGTTFVAKSYATLL